MLFHIFLSIVGMVDAHIKLAEVSACVQVIHVSQKLRLQSCCFLKKKKNVFMSSLLLAVIL